MINKKKKFQIWKHGDDTPKYLNPIKVICYGGEKLEIFLYSDNRNKTFKLFKLTFLAIFGYREFNESNLLTTWGNYDFEKNSEYNDWSLYKSKDTNFIDWLIDSSGGVIEKKDLTHYLIGFDNIVEVICFTDSELLFEEIRDIKIINNVIGEIDSVLKEE